MVPKNFEEDDLVWAKMKGYPYWPGKIMLPPADVKPKKNHHYVYFFGSKNFAWIADEFIELHGQNMLAQYGERKGGELFRKAVDTIVEQSKDISKYHSLIGKTDNASKGEGSQEKSDKVANSVSQFKSKRPLGYSSLQKFKKKLPMKKVIPVATASGEKSSRKRPHSPDLDESEGSSILILDDGDATASNRVRDGIYNVCHSNHPHERKICRSILERERIPLPIIPPIDLNYRSLAFRRKKIQPTNKKIGFLGLSKVGQAVVKNLCHSGHSVIIWSETPEECKKFAEHFKIKVANTPAELIAAADIAMCYVSDPEIAKNIVRGRNGVLEGLERSRGTKSFVEMTLVDPKLSLMFSTDITSKGGRYLEAPFSGSLIEALEGTLLIVAAGDQAVYDDCRSCFNAISKKHVFISAEVGNASKLNIVHNMLIGTVYASLGEALSLIDECNLKGDSFVRVAQVAPLNSSGMISQLVAMLFKNYTPYFPLKEMQKNFYMGLAFGDGISQHSSLFANANELYKRCIIMNYGDHDVSAIHEGTY